MIDSLPIHITERAAQKLSEFMTNGDIDDAKALRLDVVGGSYSGLAYDLYFDDAGGDDLLFESEGVRIAIRPDCLAWLLGSTVDWQEGENGAGFRIANPNIPEQ